MQQIKAEAKALHINTGRKTAGPETERTKYKKYY